MMRELKTALRKPNQGSSACKVARFFFKQHTTPHSGTGKSLAQLMMGRRLRSPLDRLHPSSNSREGCSLRDSTRTFSRGDAVYVRNFGPGPRRLAARILQRQGHVTYVIQTEGRKVHRRHVDHLRKAWMSFRRPCNAPTTDFFVFPAASAIFETSDTAEDEQQPSQVTSAAKQPLLRRSTRTRFPVKRYGVDEF